MNRVFEPGSLVEIDYCDGIDIFEPTTGEILKTELFVGVLCHSRYTFAARALKCSHWKKTSCDRSRNNLMLS